MEFLDLIEERKRGPAKRPVSVKLPVKKVEQIDAAAERLGVARSVFLETALDYVMSLMDGAGPAAKQEPEADNAPRPDPGQKRATGRNRRPSASPPAPEPEAGAADEFEDQADDGWPEEG